MARGDYACVLRSPFTLGHLRHRGHRAPRHRARARARAYIQSSPYFDPTHTRTGWIGQPPILDRLEVVTDNGDVDTLGQATP